MLRRCLVRLSKKKLSREEVEALAERARNEQRLWDAERRIFGGHIGWGHPLLWLLAGGAVVLHYANARRDLQREENEARLEDLRRLRDKPTDVDALIAHKRHQMETWTARAVGSDAAAADARARVDKLQAEINDLDFNRPPD